MARRRRRRRRARSFPLPLAPAVVAATHLWLATLARRARDAPSASAAPPGPLRIVVTDGGVREGGAGRRRGGAPPSQLWRPSSRACAFDTDGEAAAAAGPRAPAARRCALAAHCVWCLGPGIDLAPAAATRRPGASGHASFQTPTDTTASSSGLARSAAAATACRRPPSPTTTAGPTAAAATTASAATAAVLGVWPICRRLSATRSTLSSTYCSGLADAAAWDEHRRRAAAAAARHAARLRRLRGDADEWAAVPGVPARRPPAADAPAAARPRDNQVRRRRRRGGAFLS